MEPDILIVDDSSAIRRILERVLRQTGLEFRNIYEAADGEAALACLKTHHVDVILSDINMPRMDGLQFLAAVKTSDQWRGVPVIMITTEGSETKVSDALRLGASGYVRKPFTAEYIKEKLTAALSRNSPNDSQ